MIGWRGAGTPRAVQRQLGLLLVPVLLLLGVLTTLEYFQRRDDAERDLLRRADERAQELEAVVRPAMAQVHDLARLLESRWNDPPDSGPLMAKALAGSAAAGWSMDAADPALRGRLGQFWWAAPDGSPPEGVWLRRAQMFVEPARIARERNPSFEATWFAAADANVSFGTPWIATEAMLRSMNLPALAALDGPRRSAAERSRRALAADPRDTSFWGAPTVSQLGPHLVLKHGWMVVADGRYRGEVSLDLRLDDLQERVHQWGATADPGTRVWIVDASHHVLADSAQPLSAPAGPGRADTPVRVPLAERLPAGLGRADLDATLFGRERVHRGHGQVLTAAVRIGSPWIYVQATPAAVLRNQVLPTLLPNALLALALLALFIAAQWMLARNFVQPALAILDYLRSRSADAAAPAPQLGPRWQRWVDAVTETFRRQRELQQRERQTEALKASIIDHAIAGIISTDLDGSIVEFNPAAEAMFGVRRDDALGRPAAQVILPERFRAGHARELQRVADGEAPRRLGQRLQMRALHSDGHEFPVELVIFKTEFGGESLFTAWLVDVTERVQSAQQIERQRDALRQSEKLSAMGSLLAGVAHELNNPLAIVMGRASLLEEKTEGHPLQADAQRIREAAERCGRIVRTFLNMARQKPAQRAPVQINGLVQAAADMLGYTLRSHGIALDLALADDLPEVIADGDQVGQVLLNLVVNAQQALADVPPGRRRIHIATGLEARRDNREPRVWLRVADSGPGVPDEVSDRIFEPFFTTKAEGIGTGLGLSVSRSLLREHGGDLVLERGGPGAAFRLSLPISGAGQASAAPAPEPAATGHGRVLVVDDEAELADLMRSMLEGAGWEVATAESGAVAMELLDAASFDAVVSDLRMPDMDGAAFWRAVREQHPRLAQRILFVTGDTLGPEAQDFLGRTRCASLDKPFTRGDLLAAVRNLVDA